MTLPIVLSIWHFVNEGGILFIFTALSTKNLGIGYSKSMKQKIITVNCRPIKIC